MAKRRKKEKPMQPRLARDVFVEVGKMIVENPDWSADRDGAPGFPRYTEAECNVRADAITALVNKGALDKAQRKAAERFQILWNRLGGSGVGAMDYSRVVVDGGKSPDPISASQMEAGRDLKEAEKALKAAHGTYAYRLVGYVCGQGYSIHDLTETRRQRDTMTDLLRMYLDVLADLWGYSGGNRRKAM